MKRRKTNSNKLTYEIGQQDHQRDWDDNGTQSSTFPVTVLIGLLQVKGRPRKGTSGKGPRGRWVHSAGRQGISRRRCTKKGRSASRFEQEVPEGRKTNSKWLLTQIDAEGDVGWENGDCCQDEESSSTQCWLRTWTACTKEKNKNQRQVTQSKRKQNQIKKSQCQQCHRELFKSPLCGRAGVRVRWIPQAQLRQTGGTGRTGSLLALPQKCPTEAEEERRLD